MALGLVAACGGGQTGAGQGSGAAAEGDGSDTGADGSSDLEELNVAYFLEWPTANIVAQAEKTYDAELGLTVNWIPFASGGDMAQAMEAGDIDISYSQGVTPFANFATGGFAEAYPEVVTGFLQVTEDANRAHNADREPLIDAIAEAVGIDREATVALLDDMTFPEKEAQLSEDWLGGTVQSVMKEQMDFFASEGEIESALPSYDSFVDTSFLEAVD